MKQQGAIDALEAHLNIIKDTCQIENKTQHDIDNVRHIINKHKEKTKPVT